MEIIVYILKNPFFQNIFSGVIGGLIVLVFQKLSDKRDRQNEIIKKSIVGKKELKILSNDFLYQYEPGKIAIQRLIEEFGEPQRKYQSKQFENFIFEFQNAKLEVINSTDNNSVVALTVFSKLDNQYPINCRLSFEEDDQVLGKAKISDVIIENHFFFESYDTQLGFETVIGTKNAYRQTKHLSYFYLIGGNYEKIQDAKNAIISQVCVTEIEDVYSFFSFYDTFYN